MAKPKIQVQPGALKLSERTEPHAKTHTPIKELSSGENSAGWDPRGLHLKSNHYHPLWDAAVSRSGQLALPSSDAKRPGIS